MAYSLVAVLAPIHLFAFSALLGTELWQSFAITKIACQALPRSAFISLQKRVFPVYFQSQTLLVFLVAATFPSCGSMSFLEHWAEGLSLIVACVTAVLNLLVYGPKTQRLMIERVHQGMLNAIVREFAADLISHSRRKAAGENRSCERRQEVNQPRILASSRHEHSLKSHHDGRDIVLRLAFGFKAQI